MRADAEADADVWDDAALMARVQAGDENALGELMRRWERPVKAVIARMVLNIAEADDLAQDTFVRVWKERARFRPGAAFKPWLLSIALNLARNRLRWWRRRPTVSLDEWEGIPARETAAATVESGASSAEAAERAAAVRDAVAELPLALRDVIILSEYEQMSHAEIASALGATPKAVETRLHRARQKLRARLKSLLR